MKYIDRPAFINPFEKKFAMQCDFYQPKILERLRSLPDRRCYLKDLIRYFFIEDERSDYGEIHEIMSYVTMDLIHTGILEWDENLKLYIKE